MNELDAFNQYEEIGPYLENIRKGKGIPLRLLDENGVSSRTYQRFVRGESDIRLSDYAIILELFSLSPYESTRKLSCLSQTVTYKFACLHLISNENFLEAEKLIKKFEDFINTSAPTLGKQEALYKVYSMDYLCNPNSGIDIEKIRKLEKSIYNHLVNATIYTSYDLDFLGFQKLNGLTSVSHKLFLKVLQTESIQPVIDSYSSLIIEKAIISFLIDSIRCSNDNISISIEIIKNYICEKENMLYSLWKNVALYTEKYICQKEKLTESWSDFKKKQLIAMETLCPDGSNNNLITSQINSLDYFFESK